MPDGHTHNRATGLLIAVTIGGALYLGAPLVSSADVIAGMTVGFFVGPDLDVDGGSIAMNNIRQNIGRLPAWLWKVFWWPYATLMPHRSYWSHTPIIGTLVRVGYMAFMLFPLAIWVASTVDPWHLLFVFAGLCAVDTLHWFMDIW